MSSDEEGGEEEKTEEVLVTNDVNKVWESYVDETSGATYYYNILTGQITIKQIREEFRDREMSNRGVFQWLRETRERSDHLSELQRSVHKRAVYKQLEDFVCFREALRRMIVR